MPSSPALRDDLRAYAHDVGFGVVGFTSVDPFPAAYDAIEDRLRRGYLEGLGWLDHRRAAGSTRPGDRHPWARSIVAVALAYGPALPVIGVVPGATSRAVVARAARGPDYHRMMRQRLRLLARWIEDNGGSNVKSQCSFDAGWLVDRAVAHRAGIGVYGDNASIITREFGSWVCLGALLTSVELPEDGPMAGGCAGCAACIAACPTGALLGPGIVNASRCVAYLTMEHAGSIAPSLRPAIGNRLVGCDTCQDVCPHNRRARPAAVPDLLTPIGIGAAPDPAELLALGEEEFDRRFHGTVIRRMGRERLARNSAIVLGNTGGEGSVPALARALEDESESVREHAAWALERLRHPVQREAGTTRVSSLLI